MATKEQEPFIDTLIEVCNYNLVFNQLRDSIIQDIALEHRLKKSKIKGLKNEIKYEYARFRDSAHNCFARKSEGELKQMITKYRTLNIQKLTPELKYLRYANAR